jgi:bifunctional UDP-N-acetylglucosamine pyrophosphorylase/glucosamine-1-phosphate N-acetyltransferase
MEILDPWRMGKEFRGWKRTAHYRIEHIETEIGTLLEQCQAKGMPIVHPSVTIHPTAIVEPTVILGDNVVIGPFCYVRDYVVLEDDVLLGYNIEISNAVILRRTQIHHSAFIGNSMIGESCNLGSWFVTSTRNLGQPTVGEIDLGEDTFISARRHHGAAIGDGVEVGVHVCTMPGATIGHSSQIFPTSIVGGALPPESRGFFKPSWAG